MAVDNWLKDIRDALWQALDADHEFRRLTAGGTRFEFSRGLLKRVEIQPGMCPIVALAPHRAELPPVESPQSDEPDTVARFGAQLATAGPVVETCEELLLAFHAALLADWTRLSALRSSRLVRINFEDIEFTLWPTKEAARPVWLCEFSLACIFEPS